MPRPRRRHRSCHEAAAYRAAADDLKTNFNQYLWDATAKTYLGGINADGSLRAVTCHAAMIALTSGIVPANRIADVRAYFLANYNSAITYPYTAFWALEQLYQIDTGARDAEALNYIRSKWAGVMTRTDTGTLTEGFNGGEACHNFGASCAYFLSSYVLGARMDGPASANKLVIEPRPGGLPSASGSVVTELGVVPVSWTLVNGKLDLACTVPAGPPRACASRNSPRKKSAACPGRRAGGQPAHRRSLFRSHGGGGKPPTHGGNTARLERRRLESLGPQRQQQLARLHRRALRIFSNAHVRFNEIGAANASVALSGTLHPPPSKPLQTSTIL